MALEELFTDLDIMYEIWKPMKTCLFRYKIAIMEKFCLAEGYNSLQLEVFVYEQQE